MPSNSPVGRSQFAPNRPSIQLLLTAALTCEFGALHHAGFVIVSRHRKDIRATRVHALTTAMDRLLPEWVESGHCRVSLGGGSWPLADRLLMAGFDPFRTLDRRPLSALPGRSGLLEASLNADVRNSSNAQMGSALAGAVRWDS